MPYSSNGNRYILYGVAVSCLFHLAFIITLSRLPPTKPDPQELAPIMVDMSLEPLRAMAPKASPESKQQIVSETQQKEESQAPDNAKFLSDKNIITEHEQIKRGDGLDAGLPGIGQGATQQPQPLAMQMDKPATKVSSQQPKLDSRPKQPAGTKQKQPSASETEPSENKLKYLSLDPNTIQEKFSPSEPSKTDSKLSPDIISGQPLDTPTKLSSYRPFSRPFGTGARFLGKSGNSDYLPDLPDGDITLLNAKADQFAVFVRRVATRVFGELRSSGWERLGPQDIASITTDCTVIAKISPKGDLLSLRIDDSSGSGRFDRVLYDSVRKAAHDPNPPSAAARPDGNIYFIFKAKSWVDFMGGGRNGAPVERRWLLLATGLE